MEKQLPKNWVETSPLQISKIIRGVSYGKTDAFQVEFDNSCLILRGGNIQDGEIVDGKDNVYVPLDLIKKEQFIQEHDVVIVGSTGSKNLIGKAATSLYNSDKISFGAFLMNIRASEPINKRYFSYYFQTNYYREAIRNLAGGVNINNIRKEYIENLYFPLPPLAEQNRIVVKLDTLFAQLETIKASMAKIPVLLKEFRQQVLTQAVTGKLTEEWRKKKKLGKWENISSSKLFEFVTSGSRGWAQYYDQSGKQLFVRITNMNYGTSMLDLNKDKLQFLKLPDSSEGKRTLLKARDILISITADIGMISLIPENFPYEAYVNQHVCLARPVKTINEQFLVNYLMSEKGFGQLKDRKKGATKAGLNLSDIKDLNIEIPTIEEQQEIVSRVESLFAKADAIEQQYLSVKEKIDNLPQALLHKAFKGELTKQLESDGDARELLQQIQELKNSTVQPKKATSKKVKKYPENETVLGMVAEAK